MADGVTSRDNFKHSAIEERRNATLLANEILGIHDLTILSYPDNQMDSVTRLKLIKVIEGAIERCHPDIIYRHHAGDVNIDHRVVHDAVMAACRPQPGSYVKRILFCEIPSNTEWRPPASKPFFPQIGM